MCTAKWGSTIFRSNYFEALNIKLVCVCSKSTCSFSSPASLGDSCEDPGTPVNGFRQGSSTFGVGSQVFYACYPGYELVGDIQRQCLAGQSWSTAQPTCQGRLAVHR